MQLYIVRRKVFKSGDEEKEKYYGIPVTSQKVTEDDLAREISIRTSLTEPDVLAAVSALAQCIHEHLEEGDTVSLKGIGTFAVSGTSEGCDTPEECTPAKMKAQRVYFKADKWLRAVLEKIKYKRTERKVKR